VSIHRGFALAMVAPPKRKKSCGFIHSFFYGALAEGRT